MKLIRTSLFLSLLMPGAAFPQKTGDVLKELQRDVAQQQDDIRRLDKSITTLTEMVRQILERVDNTNKGLAVLENGMRDRLSEQSKNLVGPVAGLNSKVDQMTTEFQSVRVSMDDLTSRMKKLESQVTDVGNTLNVMKAPPAAPPPQGGGAATPSGPAAAAAPPAGMSAKQVYDSAMRDRTGGNLDLALQGFTTYLQYYGTTDLAPNAQFYIGQILYDKNDFPGALQAFDAVLERFQENNKTPDAMYMKGMALLKSGQRTEAAKEFLNVIQKFPNSEVAPKARSQRRALGLSVPSAQGAAHTTAAKKRRR
ncbi:MAG TPA: tetratricopeptide repeat protein [Bryobacteraceae bacterium]|nr:tetratricopeptide repeat protein [Bryobacteraceae bacterium]